MFRVKVADTIHHYDGYYDNEGICRVGVWTGEGEDPVVIITELPDNPSTSVTNLAEHLFPEAIAEYLPGWLDQARYCTLIEHYPAVAATGRYSGGSYDQVTFASWNPRLVREHGKQRISFGEPHWRRLHRDEVVALIGEDGLEGEQVEAESITDG